MVLTLAGLGFFDPHLLSQEASADALRLAKQALSEGRYSEAEAIYRKLLRATPASAVLLTDLGVALDVQGRPQEAADAFERSLKIKNDPRSYVLLAKERCDLNDAAAVEPMLTAIVKEDAGRPDLLRVIAPCLLRLGHPVDAVAVGRQLVDDPSTVSDVAFVDLTHAYLASAQFFFRQLSKTGGREPYVAALQKARSDDDAGARGAYGLAAAQSVAFHAEATYTEAVAAWREHPADPALLYQLCVLSGEGSLATLTELRGRYPASPFAGQLVAEMLADQGRRDEARTQYEDLLKIDPELPGLRDDLGMLLVQEQDWNAALPVFEQQLQHHPADQQAAAHVSQCMLELEKFAELKAFLLPRAHSPHAPLWVRLDLAAALQHFEDRPGAIAQLVLAEKSFPAAKSVHYRLLRLYTMNGDMEAAAREKAMFENAN